MVHEEGVELDEAFNRGREELETWLDGTEPQSTARNVCQGFDVGVAIGQSVCRIDRQWLFHGR